MVRNAALQFLRIGFVMNENGVVPIRVKERFATPRQQTLSRGLAPIENREVRAHTFLPDAAAK